MTVQWEALAPIEKFRRDGDGNRVVGLECADSIVGVAAGVDVAALTGAAALLLRTDAKRVSARIASVEIAESGGQRKLVVRLGEPVPDERLQGGTVYVPREVWALAITRPPPLPPLSTCAVAAEEAAQKGLPRVGFRFDHTCLSATKFPSPGCYVGCSGPPGGLLRFSIFASSVPEGDASAVRLAMLTQFSQSPPAVEGVEGESGHVDLAGASRAAFSMARGRGVGRAISVGVLVGTMQGTLLVVAEVGAPEPRMLRIDEVVNHPWLRGCVQTLAFDGGATRPTAVGSAEAMGKRSAVSAAKFTGPIGLTDETSGPDDLSRWGPTRVVINGWESSLSGGALPRALGCLLGLAVGDALGTTHEFKALEAAPFPQFATGPLTDVVGGGPFALVVGQVTDDTQMASVLADVFASTNSFDVGQLAVRYLAWRSAAFDVGVQIRQVLDRVEQGATAERAGRLVWEERQRFPAGNGALMRTPVIGVMLAGKPEARRQASFLDTCITHFDPRCQLASAALNASIAHALMERPSPASMVRAAVEEVHTAAAELRGRHADLIDEIDAAERALQADLHAAHDDDPNLYGDELHLHKTAGFVRVAFRLAYWELLHAPDFAAAVLDAANRGGDADTNAAIVGALWGAFAGIHGIPARWVEKVLSAPGLAADDWEFHPRVFLRALARGFGAARDEHTMMALAPYVACAYPEYGTLAPPPPVEMDVPPGVPLSTASFPLRAKPATELLKQLLACARDGGEALRWMSPELVHVAGDGSVLRVTGVARPRAGWTSESDIAAWIDATPRALLCAAPEVLSRTEPYFTSTVFSACAVFLYAVRRHGPYAPSGPPIVVSELDLPAWLHPTVLSALRSGLNPDPRARPPASVLYELVCMTTG